MANRAPLPYDFLPPVPSFPVISADMVDGHPMSDRHVYDGDGTRGGNVSPHLSWSGFPAETKSFAITCYDPDAGTGSGFWHWLLVDIPVSVTALASGAGSVPDGLPVGTFHVCNDFGDKGFRGAVAVAGDPAHRYVFAVHALDSDKLGIDSGTTPALAGLSLSFHTIARGLLVPVGHNLVSRELHFSPVPIGDAIRYVPVFRRHLQGARPIAAPGYGRQDMKAISKILVSALVIASLIGASAVVAVAIGGARTPAAHPAPRAATAIEYGLIAAL